LDAVRPGLPRIIVAGLAGDTGKSLVTLGLARTLVRRGRRVAPFKKGPDFIDAAWLAAAARVPGRNLDTYLMSPAAIVASVERASRCADLALVEGNRGLFDGVDARGSHSTAQLSKLIGAPVVLVVNCTKATRTVAAQVLGCKVLDPGVALAGVVLNRVGTRRQEAVIREAVLGDAGVPVLGAIPRLEGEPLPSRHLGLVCAGEHPEREAALEAIAAAVERYVDVEAVCTIAANAGSMPGAVVPEPARSAGHARIGVLRDAAFSFYYPENLEALEAAGAELVWISPLADRALPAIDALYAGGGFPEEYAGALAENAQLRGALAAAIADGLPVWAECGGLMYLSRSIRRDGRDYPMVGALPISVEHTPRPQGHGYMAATVDRENPFLPVGTRLVGHEFHYSRLASDAQPGLSSTGGEGGFDTVLAVERGVGLGQSRDGLAAGNVVATYLHLHALGTPEWAPALVRAALARAALASGRGAPEGKRCSAGGCQG
jgi:cobyrinic acid a,c-diamide synthase